MIRVSLTESGRGRAGHVVRGVPTFPAANKHRGFRVGLIRFHSQLLTESLLISYASLIYMLKFRECIRGVRDGFDFVRARAIDCVYPEKDSGEEHRPRLARTRARPSRPNSLTYPGKPLASAFSRRTRHSSWYARLSGRKLRQRLRMLCLFLCRWISSRTGSSGNGLDQPRTAGSPLSGVPRKNAH